MPTVVLRISLICHLFNTILLHFLPKRLRALLPRSWLPTAQPEIETRKAPLNLSRSNPGASPPCSPHSFLPFWGQSPMDESDEKGPPEMDPAELKRVFQMFDRNGDGHITKKELSDSLENLGIYIPDGDLAAMIEKIDVNRDGCVDMDEFGALYRTIMDERDEEEDMREAFNVFDQNGDGFITVEELRSVLASLGLKQGRTVDDCRRMIRKVDVDGDGMVDFKEFKQMMRGGGFAALS